MHVGCCCSTYCLLEYIHADLWVSKETLHLLEPTPHLCGVCLHGKVTWEQGDSGSVPTESFIRQEMEKYGGLVERVAVRAKDKEALVLFHR